MLAHRKLLHTVCSHTRYFAPEPVVSSPIGKTRTTDFWLNDSVDGIQEEAVPNVWLIHCSSLCRASSRIKRCSSAEVRTLSLASTVAKRRATNMACNMWADTLISQRGHTGRCRIGKGCANYKFHLSPLTRKEPLRGTKGSRNQRSGCGRKSSTTESGIPNSRHRSLSRVQLAYSASLSK